MVPSPPKNAQRTLAQAAYHRLSTFFVKEDALEIGGPSMTYAQAIERLRDTNWLEPKIDQKVANAALKKIFALSGVRERPVQWITAPQVGPSPVLMETKVLGKHLMDGKRIKPMEGYLGREAERLTRRTAASAALLSCGVEPWSDDSMSIAVPAGHGLLALKYEPSSNEAKLGAEYIKFLCAGAFAICLTRNQAYVLQRPRLHTQNGLIHCTDAPAVLWPGSKGGFYWRGVEVGEQAILRPQEITLPDVQRISGRKRAVATMSRWLSATDAGLKWGGTDIDKGLHAKLIHAEGQTWRVGILRVENPTPTKEGKLEVAYLMVPWRIQRCREAVAWTYGMSEAEYQKVHRT